MFKSIYFSGMLKSRCLYPLLLALILCSGFLVNPAFAARTFPDQARNVVEGWMTLNGTHLGADLSARSVGRAEAYPRHGDPLYFVVYLRENGQQKGFVVVAGEDRIEPIIGFFPEAREYDPSTANPAGALVQRDLEGRMQRVLAQSENRTADPEGPEELSAHSRKWDYLASVEPGMRYSGVSSIDDVWISPLVESRWSQGDDGGDLCYNYHTPNHYVCGCVATAMAQLMRYHTHPADGVGTPTFDIKVDGTSQTANLRGGDGAGGAYGWGDMVLDPGAGLTDAQRQAIGALTHDAGVAVRMSYAAGGSGAWLGYSDQEFVNTFGYGNSVYSYDFESATGFDDPSLNQMINPNLDAGYPVLLGIDAEGGGGHAIVCDGYGYELASMYHHLNLGWGGYEDAWYNLPDVAAGGYTFYAVSDLVYNVFVSGSGEIISGRVTDESGSPISGASVTAARAGGGSYSDSTDANGIYALAKIPADADYTISVSKDGYTFSSSAAESTGTSESSSTGNVWGVDFTGSEGDAPPPEPSEPMPTLAPLYQLLLQ